MKKVLMENEKEGVSTQNSICMFSILLHFREIFFCEKNFEP